MSAQAATFWATRVLSRVMGGEKLLGAAGCVMACGSGAFALYMGINGPAPGFNNGGGYFTVFAQQLEAKKRPTAIATADVDPMVTGSIKTGHKVLSADGRPILVDIVLRQVDGDSAMVEQGDSLAVYRIGDVIPGGGRFLSITQQGGRPALETTRGLIVEVP